MAVAVVVVVVAIYPSDRMKMSWPLMESPSIMGSFGLGLAVLAN